MLNVDKVIIGSVSKLDNYKIEIRIVDVNSKKIDKSYSIQVNNEIDFENSANIISKRILTDYINIDNLQQHKTFFSLGLYPGLNYAYGKYAEDTQRGFGGQIAVSYTPNKYYFNILGGYNYFMPKEDYIKRFTMIPLQIFFGYTIFETEQFEIIPALGMGYLFSFIKKDTIKNRINDDYLYKSEFIYNPICSFKTEFGWAFYGNNYLIFTTAYSIIFEKTRRGHLFSINLGYKRKF